MKFSIIIPLYNKAPYVEKAIQSVLTQTYEEFELIVIDDGSNDGSLEKIQKFRSSKVQIISQENQGVSITRNNGVKLAKYDYIAFLDADDWWESTFLQEMKKVIEEYPNAGIYASSYYKIKNGKRIPANIGVEDSFESGVINYFRVYSTTLWMPLTSISVVIPKEVFVYENGFNSSLKLGEDFDLWIRIAQKYPVVFINKLLAYYNQDVDVSKRAVGEKFYKPDEHMLFSDYSTFSNNNDFIFLFQRLALYGLLPYYLNKKNTSEVNHILQSIDWKKHEKKYYLYYKIVPRVILNRYLSILKVGSKIKSFIRK
jgi:glycosyltransferase involved in cell wall biosynthesis